MKKAKINVGIASWWGQNDGFGTDAAFRGILDFTEWSETAHAYGEHRRHDGEKEHEALRWVIYYEKPAYAADPHLWPAGFSWQAVENDMNYVLRNYANRPGYLHIDGRPVVFVYMPGATSSDVQQWVTVRNDTKTYIDLSVDPTQMSGVSPEDLDSWHVYNPTVRYQSAGSYYASVSPGFWRDQTSCTPNCPMQLARDPVAFDTAVRELAQAQTTWKLIETWNEWGEGTSVEPGTEVTQQSDFSTAIVPASPQRADGCYGDAYVNALARDLPEHRQVLQATARHRAPDRNASDSPAGTSP